jgi:hypothetical protein
MSNMPLTKLISAKKRICPSDNWSSWENMRRQPIGDKNGNRPSKMRTSPKASQKVSLSSTYFFPPTAEPPPRKTLKNSDDAGSSTITSLLFAKLAL